MYAIYVTNLINNTSGWFIRTKINSGDEFVDKFNGEQRVEPVFAFDKSKRKVWKTEKAVLKYADTLFGRLETITYYPDSPTYNKYVHRFNYMLNVVDIETNEVVKRYYRCQFESTC